MYPSNTTVNCFLAAVLALCSAISAVAAPPAVPVISGSQISATASGNSLEQYTYTYSVTNPSTNTGEIRDIRLDITHQLDDEFSIPNVLPEIRTAVEPVLIQRGLKVLPVELQAPSGWRTNNFTVDGQAVWGKAKRGPQLTPGQSLGGFVLKSQFFPPALRQVVLVPAIASWNLYPDADDPEEVQREREALIASLDLKTYTLGPAAVFAGTFNHWNTFRDSLSLAISLGWCTDAASGDTLVAQLASARAALDAGEGSLAKARLQTLLGTLSGITTAKCRTEVLDLTRLNAQSLILHTANTPIKFEPKLSLSPKSVELALGGLCTITAKVVNVADNNRPIPNFDIGFEIREGPNSGLDENFTTDVNGEAKFEYTGRLLGLDRIAAGQIGEVGIVVNDEALVSWNAAPDLVVPLFTPPQTTGQARRIYITDVTENIGQLASPSSITRFYVSSAPITDENSLRNAANFGQRQVPALLPGESSSFPATAFTLPPDVSGNPLYFAACADGPNTVIEEDENNNCSFNKLNHSGSSVGVLLSENQPPDCAQAQPSIDSLWPPNHKLKKVSIAGITDADNDPVTIKIEKITQDESVNGLGDGDTSPDGFIQNNTVELRAERSGTGNGRVYTVTFLADDGRGGSCTGTVRVGVPHDQGQGSTPIDDGQQYNSTLP